MEATIDLEKVEGEVTTEAKPVLVSFSPREAMRYDIRLHGHKAIIGEFIGASALGIWASLLYLLNPHLSFATRVFEVFWLGFSLNCLTILLLSIRLAKSGTRKEPTIELGSSQISQLRRFTILIGLVILLPFATLIVSLYQISRGVKR